MKGIVKENLGGIGSILKPKSQKEVTDEIRYRLQGKDLETIKETEDYTIYQVKKGSDIKEIVRNFGGRDEDVFYNFYLILDNSTTGFKQIIGIKVSPDGTIQAMDAKGQKVEKEYLEKFS
jgi:hypothetical protein